MSTKRGRSKTSTAPGGLVIVDTHLLIEYFGKKLNHDTREIARLALARRLAITWPVYYELLTGTRSERDSEFLRGRLGALPSLATTCDVWLCAVELYRTQTVHDHRLPMSDVLIAAHGFHYCAAVYTRDPHFDVFEALPRHELGH